MGDVWIDVYDYVLGYVGDWVNMVESFVPVVTFSLWHPSVEFTCWRALYITSLRKRHKDKVYERWMNER